jgi:hypothetical protein
LGVTLVVAGEIALTALCRAPDIIPWGKNFHDELPVTKIQICGIIVIIKS